MTAWLWKPKYLTGALLTIAGLLVGYLCYGVFKPFLAPTIWAAVLALLFHPLYQPAVKLLRSRSLAALLLCLVATMILALPCIYLISSLRTQLWDVYDEVEQTLSDPTGQTADTRLQRGWRWVVDTAAKGGYHLPAALSEVLQRGASRMISSTPAVIGGIFEFIIDLTFVFLTLFFFLRDGERLVHWLQDLVPLNAEQTAGLFAKIRDVIQATVFGGLAVALAQGLIGGALFYGLGLPTPLLWGVVMGILSLLPPLGAWLVWGPAVGILFWQGPIWKAVILLIGGVLGISLIDNLLRPMIIGHRAQLPTLLVFFSLAGGLQFFGPIGLVAGPVLVALLIGILDFIRERLQLAAVESEAGKETPVSVA